MLTKKTGRVQALDDLGQMTLFCWGWQWFTCLMNNKMKIQAIWNSDQAELADRNILQLVRSL